MTLTMALGEWRNVLYPHANDLYFNILRMCPHNEARAGFEHLFETAKAAGEPDNELCAMLAFRLVDALRYGNWPEAPKTTT